MKQSKLFTFKNYSFTQYANNTNTFHEKKKTLVVRESEHKNGERYIHFKAPNH